MRKAKINQQPEPVLMVCPSCKDGSCFKCADVLLARVGRRVGCKCRRSSHLQALADAQQGVVGSDYQEPSEASRRVD